VPKENATISDIVIDLEDIQTEISLLDEREAPTDNAFANKLFKIVVESDSRFQTAVDSIDTTPYIDLYGKIEFLKAREAQWNSENKAKKVFV